jgi:diguanylate cyclase
MPQALPKDAGDDTRLGFDEVAQRAIDFARRYRTTLTPPVFEVWFTYVRRTHALLNTTLDTAMNTNAPITEASLTDFWHQNLSPRAMTDDVAAISKVLQAAMGDVTEAMDGGLRDASALSGSLRSVKQTLTAGSSKRDVAEIITRLHRINQEQIASSQKLTVQLEKNRAQVSKLERELVDLKRSANTDYLTGLANRRRLDDLLDQALLVARQRGTPLSFVLADIDGMRAVNDRWGHSVGDNVLKIFANELRRPLRGAQIPARFASAKFALLLPDTTTDQAFALAESIREKFRKFDWVREGSGESIGEMTVSLGVTELHAGDDKAALTDRAAGLLSAAKADGRNKSLRD